MPIRKLKVSLPPLRSGVPQAVKRIDSSIVWMSKTETGKPHAETLARFYVHRQGDSGKLTVRTALDFLALVLELGD